MKRSIKRLGGGNKGPIATVEQKEVGQPCSGSVVRAMDRVQVTDITKTQSFKIHPQIEQKLVNE